MGAPAPASLARPARRNSRTNSHDVNFRIKPELELDFGVTSPSSIGPRADTLINFNAAPIAGRGIRT
jgi:hypothetical protein